MMEGEQEKAMNGYAQWNDKQQKSSQWGITQARHSKRLVPEALKDKTYWVKRNKNNIAAKRSRESRRCLESDIRSRIDILEKENTLLKKEISLLKSKYGIPPEHSMLTYQERFECLQEFDESRSSSAKADMLRESSESMLSKKNSLERRVIVTDYENRSTKSSPQSSDHEDEKRPVSREYGYPISFNNSPDAVVWSTSGKQHIHMEHNGSDRQFTIEDVHKMQNINSYGHIGHFPYHYLSHQMGQEGHDQGFLTGANRKQAHISSELSMTKSDDLRNGNMYVHIPTPHRISPSMSKENGQVYPKSPSYEAKSSERNVAGPDHLNKYELRRKIMQLSAQCEELNDFVSKT